MDDAMKMDKNKLAKGSTLSLEDTEKLQKHLKDIPRFKAGDLVG